MHFTIITPSLNYGRYLGDCLESVAAQEGVTIEHLVIDGGSADDSAEVAARFLHVICTIPTVLLSDWHRSGLQALACQAVS